MAERVPNHRPGEDLSADVQWDTKEWTAKVRQIFVRNNGKVDDPRYTPGIVNIFTHTVVNSSATPGQIKL